ncbi:hypothetical protein ACFRJ8_15775 [Arthrobacter sp. NPDC056886]
MTLMRHRKSTTLATRDPQVLAPDELQYFHAPSPRDEHRWPRSFL